MTHQQTLDTDRRSLPAGWHWGLLILVIESVVLLMNSAELLPRSNSYLTRGIVGSALALLLISSEIFFFAAWDYIKHRKNISIRSPKKFNPALIGQITVCVLIFLTIQQFPSQGPQGVIDTSFDDKKRILYSIIGFEFIPFFTLTALCFAEIDYWKKLIRIYKNILMISGVFITLIVVSRVFYFDPDKVFYELFLEPTLYLSHLIGQSLGLNLIQSANLAIYGTPLFKVSIGAECAGYQGMSILLTALIAYVYFHRDELILSRLFLVAIMGSGILFILNALRIALLVWIGHHWSPTVAINGFHSVAGLLMLLLVLALVLFLLNEWSWLRKSRVSIKQVHQDYFFWAAPLLVVIAISLLTTAFSSSFYWAYPVHIIVVGFYMWIYRARLPALLFPTSIHRPFIAGIAVFVLWVVLIPNDPIADNAFEQEMLSVPIYLSGLWLFVRLMGSIIIVPMVEELAFRSFLWRYLDEKLNGRYSEGLIFSAKLILSSLAFAVLHAAFVASFIASLIYGYVYNQKKQLSDAVIAHGITNFLLGLYILFTDQWSYW